MGEGCIVLRALSQAYPKQIRTLRFSSRVNDWIVQGQWQSFSLSNRKDFAGNLAQNYKKYRKLGFCHYPKLLPSQPLFNADEERKFLVELAKNKKGLVVQENDAFCKALFQASNKQGCID